MSEDAENPKHKITTELEEITIGAIKIVCAQGEISENSRKILMLALEAADIEEFKKRKKL